MGFVVGASLVTAEGRAIPNQLWAYGNTLAGALLGVLVPSGPTEPPAKEESFLKRAYKNAAKFLSRNRVPLALAGLFGTSLVFGGFRNSPELLSLAGATGGALLGVLIPSPVQGKGQSAGRPR